MQDAVPDTSSTGLEVLVPRDVPLGGPRSMSVRRTLPQRHRSLVGAWCFLDHYGPDRVSTTGGMRVAPHPHAGLQTVTWLFAGEVEHRDSGGGHAVVGAGELSLMTAGHGIAHSEVSTSATTTLHGVQLWVALPDDEREGARGYHHHRPAVVPLEGAEVTVIVGELMGERSPAPTWTPLVAAEVRLEPRVSLDLGVDSAYEHAVLVDDGATRVDDEPVARHALVHVPEGRDRLTLRNDGDHPARLLLIGGTPFTEPIAMWWNFVGRDHDDIVAMREAWAGRSERFGEVAGYVGDPSRLEAPDLPHVRLRPRRARP